MQFSSLFQRARRRFAAKAVILHYHRVVDLPQDPHLIAVKPQHFAEHLAVLRRIAAPIGLQELVGHIKAGRLPRRAVAITFDDGYADNLTQARPLLERAGIPATTFITTGYLGGQREYWWDELERLLLLPERLPPELHLRLRNGPYRWDTGAADDYPKHPTWNMGWQSDPTARHHLFRSVWQLLRPLEASEQWKALDALAEWAGAPSAVRASHRTLSPDEVACLAEGGLVEIGAHTVTHPVLANLPVAAQREEIERSKKHLEEILGRRVEAFSYPHGLRADYTAATITTVREAGYGYACSSLAETAWSGSDPYQLPRILVRDWDGDEFARHLARLFKA